MSTIDQYSVATVPIEMFFGSTKLAIGTGFVWDASGEFFLITNWHNVSGRDPFSGQHISKTTAEPDRLRVWWNQKGKLGSKFAVEHALHDPSGLPLWLVHPQHGNQVDVVALPVQPHANAEMYPINGMPSEDLQIQIGTDVFVLGYPFGIGPAGLPIWKRASVASEPEIVDPDRPYMLIDTASRPGMSGSPVISRSWGTHQLEGGNLALGGSSVATRFIGVYSGRLATNDPIDVQLGLVWPANFIADIIAGGRRDS